MRTDKGYALAEFTRWTRGANDVPITRNRGEIEADLRGMLGEVEIAPRRREPADIAM